MRAAPGTCMQAQVRAGAWVAIALAMTLTVARATAPSVGVAVVQGAAWSVDSTREGAAELAVAIRIAQLRRAHAAVALICVGDRHGTLGCGGERALRRAVVMGVLVVRVASGGDVASTNDDLFLDSGTRDPATVERMLTPLLQHYGPPPAVATPERPTPSELAAIRAHLEPFRLALKDGPRSVMLE